MQTQRLFHLLSGLLKESKNVIENPKLFPEFLGASQSKAFKQKEKLNKVWKDLQVFFSLLKAWKNKSYRDVEKKTILYIVGSLIYFLNPFDLIPDFLVGGFVDDVSLFVYVLKLTQSELTKFKKWQKSQH